jgi:hypothetical protein
MKMYKIKWGMIVIMICCVVMTLIHLAYFVEWMHTVSELRNCGL